MSILHTSWNELTEFLRCQFKMMEMNQDHWKTKIKVIQYILLFIWISNIAARNRYPSTNKWKHLPCYELWNDNNSNSTYIVNKLVASLCLARNRSYLKCFKNRLSKCCVITMRSMKVTLKMSVSGFYLEYSWVSICCYNKN